MVIAHLLWKHGFAEVAPREWEYATPAARLVAREAAPGAVELALWVGGEAAPRWAEVLTDPRLLDAGVVYAKALLYTAG